MQEPSEAYEIVPWRPQHRTEVLALLEHLWGADPVVRDSHMRWKYEACPYAPGPAHVALYEGRVVGFRGSVGNRWEVDAHADAIRAVVAADLVIAPEHRADGASRPPGAQLFRRLMTGEIAHSGWVMATSAGTPARVALERLGWGSIGPIAVMHFQVRERPFARVRALGGALRDRVQVADAPRPEAMAELIARLPHDGRIRQVRDAKFFAWRFGNPLSRYRFLFLGRNRLKGYIVLQADLGDRYGRRLTISDWEAETPDGLERLMRHAQRLAGDRVLHVWTGSLDETRIEMLRAAGFEDRVQQPGRWYPTILVTPAGAARPPRPWTAHGRDLLNPANWDLRLLYSDGC